MIHRLAVSGYRSLRNLVVELDQLTVVTGPNGSGKSSLYRALRLLADVAQGRIIGSLASEGGLQSTLWAGPEKFGRGVKDGTYKVEGTVRRDPVAVKLGFASDDYGFAIDLGLPVPSQSMFSDDPDIKAEAVWVGETLNPRNLLAERRGPMVRLRQRDSGVWTEATHGLDSLDSMMTHRADANDGIELLTLRERMRSWRFYDDLRTDRDAPCRRPQVGTYTPVLSGDGADLGAALQTVLALGDAAALQDTIADAFDGAEVGVNDRFEVEMRQYGLLRPLRAAELSDGTLRYILLAVALLTPRPPALMILNEPEASLHPDLLAPLARLMTAASERCQLIVVSHAAALVEALSEAPRCATIALSKELGETHASGTAALAWTWPAR
jgi:predicted ATPase